MPDRIRAERIVRFSALKSLGRYARMTGRPFSEVEEEYHILLRPMPTDVEGIIRHCESFAKLYRILATLCDGSPVFESKGNQRKLWILRYFSKRKHATSFDVSTDLNMSLTNASERLRRYYKQGLLSRRARGKGKRGRPTMFYELTEAGRRRLAFLQENVKFRRIETDESKHYRFLQKIMEKTETDLRKGRTYP